MAKIFNFNPKIYFQNFENFIKIFWLHFRESFYFRLIFEMLTLEIEVRHLRKIWRVSFDKHFSLWVRLSHSHWELKNFPMKKRSFETYKKCVHYFHGLRGKGRGVSLARMFFKESSIFFFSDMRSIFTELISQNIWKFS